MENKSEKLVIFILISIIIFLLLALYVLKLGKLGEPILYIDNTPIISTLSYLVFSKERKDFNTFAISDLTITFNLDKPFSVNNNRQYKESITYQFAGRNNSSKSIDEMIFYLISPLCEGFDTLDYKISKPTNSFIPERVPASYTIITMKKTILKVGIPFNDVLKSGESLAPTETFKFDFIREETTDKPSFNGYLYCIDPKNYSKHTENLTIIIHIYDEKYEYTPVNIYEFDRFDGRHKLLKQGTLHWDADNACCSFVYQPHMINPYVFYGFMVKKQHSII
ncbi:MAG: hypothetical protein Q7J08_08850 [Methanocorpusculum sp.]|uniref:hypothetical protein n=1 Tax=Methanocorpusculum sp. TaxID=2058474 RepID=UPI002725FEC1|nr:hypothetical protein [Methanocorpusculum sp.]MDO9523799.1 hypothetical protein [Methanocorpusculum sp.]